MLVLFQEELICEALAPIDPPPTPHLFHRGAPAGGVIGLASR